MTRKPTNIFQKIVLIICLCYSGVYLLGCLTPYINPVHFYPLTFLSLGFPFLLGGMLLILILSLFIVRKYFWLFLVIIALGFKNISAIYGFHPKKAFDLTKKPGSFRLLSWNVNYFLDCQIKSDTPNAPRRQMFQYIRETNADVLCFQDFSSFYNPQIFYPNVEYIRDSLGYPFCYFPVDHILNEKYTPEKYGVILFSRFPITDSGSMKLSKEGESERFGFIDIRIQGKTVRMYCAHLASMQIHVAGDKNKEASSLKSDTALILHTNTFRKLKYYERIHIDEAKTIRKSLDSITGPLVFCADLNSVPSSYVYHYIRQDMQDAFLQNGSGLGRTYDSLSPTLRIDVVFLNNQLKATQHHTARLHLSDHLPNLVDLEFR